MSRTWVLEHSSLWEEDKLRPVWQILKEERQENQETGTLEDSQAAVHCTVPGHCSHRPKCYGLDMKCPPAGHGRKGEAPHVRPTVKG